MGLFSKIGDWVYDTLGGKAQNDAQRELWNEQNAYNTPKEQMKRLKEAGLNPNLVYNGGVNNTASAMTAAAAPNAASVLRDGLMAYQQIQNLAAQREFTNNQSQAAYWQAGINQHNAVKSLFESKIAQYHADYAKAEHDMYKNTGVIPQSYHKTDLKDVVQGGIMALLRKVLNVLLIVVSITLSFPVYADFCFEIDENKMSDRSFKMCACRGIIDCRMNPDEMNQRLYEYCINPVKYRKENC